MMIKYRAHLANYSQNTRHMILDVEKKETHQFSYLTSAKSIETLTFIFNASKENLTQASDEIIDLFSYFPISYFYYFLYFIDYSFPGLSIHYVMEALHSENQLALTRLNMLKNNDGLSNVFAPARMRLITRIFRDTQ